MEIISAIGERVHASWERAGFAPNAFIDIATDALGRAALHEHLVADDILAWAFGADRLPPQADPQGRFGEPPITLYAHPRFHIDALFWLDGSPSIHQHRFGGAFTLLRGSSIHSEYDFEPTETFDDRLALGALELRRVETLGPGDVRTIRPGRAFIHALFHVERPSVSVVVRTHGEGSQPGVQWDYRKPSLALDPFVGDERRQKQIALAQLAMRLEHPEGRSQLGELAQRCDALTAYRLLELAFTHTGTSGHYPALLETISERFGALGGAADASLHTMHQRDLIMARRRLVHSPEHRFLLGALASVDRAEDALSLVRQRTGDEDPVPRSIRWLVELSQLEVEGESVLGVDLDERNAWVLEHLIRGRSPQNIAHLAADPQAPSIEAKEIVKLAFVLPHNSVLRPLLSRAAP